MSTRVSTPAGAGAGERTEPGFIDNVALIAGREITMRFRSKAFLWSTAVLMLAVLASVVLGGIFGAQDSTHSRGKSTQSSVGIPTRAAKL